MLCYKRDDELKHTRKAEGHRHMAGDWASGKRLGPDCADRLVPDYKAMLTNLVCKACVHEVPFLDCGYQFAGPAIGSSCWAAAVFCW